MGQGSLSNEVKDQSGYSLFEMIIVMAVISFAAVSLFSNFRSPTSLLTAKLAAKRLVALVSLTQHAATSTQSTKALFFDLKNKTIRVDENTIFTLPKTIKIVLETADSLVEADETARINFFSDGSSSGGKVKFVDSKGNEANVHIKWITGTSTIKLGALDN